MKSSQHKHERIASVAHSIISSKVHYYIKLLVESSTPLASSLIITAAAAAAVDEKLEFLNRVLSSTT